MSRKRRTISSVSAPPYSKDIAQCMKNKFCKLSNCCSSEIALELIGDILNSYEHLKSAVNKEEIFYFFKHSLPRVCFKLQVDDSHLVSEILKCIDVLQKTQPFGIFPFFTVNFITTEKLGDGEIAERAKRGLKSYDYLTYFLHHACVSKLILNGRRITDCLLNPREQSLYLLTYTANSSATHALLSLLQYGARFSDQLSDFPPGDLDSGIQRIRGMMGKILKNVKESDLLDTQTFILKKPLSDFPEKILSMREAFRVLMRFVANPFHVTYKLGGTSTANGKLPKIKELRSYFDTLFPQMGFGWNGPPLLKHSCKCVIRERLNQNWQLPDGIAKLEIPIILKDYLNLIFD